MSEGITKLRQALAAAENRASEEQRRREEAQRRREEAQRRREEAEEIARALAIDLEYMQSLIRPISSKHGLRYYKRDTVENVVQKPVDAVYENSPLRDSLGLRGTVTFESYTNLGSVYDNLSESLECTSLSGDSAADAGPVPTVAGRKPCRATKGKGKAKALAAAIVIQLFSYMIGKGIQYGYVYTGEAFVFLHISNNPATVLYHVCMPNMDGIEDDENKLYRTAVSQVFAYILQALRAELPPHVVLHAYLFRRVYGTSSRIQEPISEMTTMTKKLLRSRQLQIG
ncbi:hypothetical protein F5883DRAFT_609768 [Diaporthe sp. PMI_573]|nr:hypothetical protein F5883DRAFT_609768 [Diaporthaceae sp. PMI_573]